MADHGFGAGVNVDEDEPLAIMGSTSSLKTMADGSLRIAIDVSPKESKPAFQLFGTPGTAVALAVIKNEVAVEHDRPKSEGLKTQYGEYARTLKLSDFFRTPDVWKAVGTDAEYLKWVKRMPSAISGEFSEYHDGVGFCMPAHVRRVEHGSGTAIKPPYSAIPLTKAEHDLAHHKGDSAIGSEEWWAKMRVTYVSDWCWETLKKHFFFDSWADVPPHYLANWAKTNDLLRYLPAAYRDYSFEESESDSQD